MYRFYQILRFVLRNYLNFKLYENLLIIYCFILLFHKLKLCFRCRVHYTPFTCGKGLLKFKNLKISQLSNCECFFSVDNQLTLFQFFSHQNSFVKKVLSLIIYKIDYFLCNYCSSSNVLY